MICPMRFVDTRFWKASYMQDHRLLYLFQLGVFFLLYNIPEIHRRDTANFSG
jgi:hypothetical protein